MTRVAVLGGGITGLVAARELRATHEVTLFEAADRLGGVLQTVHDDGLLLEEGPDSLVITKPAAVALCDDLKVPLIGTSDGHARSMVVRSAALQPVPEGFVLLAPTKWGPLLRSPLFSWAGKARMALDLVLPRGGHTDETLADFVRRRLGSEALDRLAQPMLGGVVAGDPEALSAKAVMPMLVAMEDESRSIILGMQRRRAAQRAAVDTKAASGARYGLFRTPAGGMSTVIDALIAELGDVELRVGTPVTEIVRGEGWTVNGEAFDAVVLALPVRTAERLASGIDDGLAEALRDIPSTSTATLNLVYRAEDVKHPLDAFGFVVPAAEGLSLMACTFTTRKYAGRAGEDRVVLRAFVGGALGQAAWGRSDDELIASARADLQRLLGLDAVPIRTHLARWQDRFPQLNVGHAGRVATIQAAEDRHPGLAVAGNFLTGAGVSDCIESARRAAARVRKPL